MMAFLLSASDDVLLLTGGAIGGDGGALSVVGCCVTVTVVLMPALASAALSVPPGDTAFVSAPVAAVAALPLPDTVRRTTTAAATVGGLATDSAAGGKPAPARAVAKPLLPLVAALDMADTAASAAVAFGGSVSENGTCTPPEPCRRRRRPDGTATGDPTETADGLMPRSVAKPDANAAALTAAFAAHEASVTPLSCMADDTENDAMLTCTAEAGTPGPSDATTLDVSACTLSDCADERPDSCSCACTTLLPVGVGGNSCCTDGGGDGGARQVHVPTENEPDCNKDRRPGG